ncbi:MULTISPECIES: hypothetical protein [unclassified Ensifer]|uniref:hypothetical protein n=1 Tax=unclassified Ensifer TaxID=2633371 RepID=UPI0008137151|nr:MULTISPECIES: hypothetical protein [unclassified Ensifer]OCP01288.1 hypothetical protein BC362_22895 [Ensifer sp. LC14]OCP03180.1 hypothetical protein BBX50_06015 [Ensifer sp. LC11]OCP03550.1 hypothetical protein BC374_06075 [Ensifer sp. LC13]OCP33963.1 hypothetical protein BC364_13565 [Ensifer sp. LC499]
MTLEEFTAQLNGSTFWKEFTFSQNQFSPRPGDERELADNVVWLGETAFVIQMKEREQSSDDPEVERRWFKNKVRGKAISQIKDSIGFLREQESISITNGRGRRYEIRGADIRHLEKIVLYAAGPSLPEECRSVRYHVSETAGFIHVFERNDYSLVVETLAVPEEIRRYLEYRQKALLALTEAKVAVVEADVLAAYLSDEELPSPSSHKALDRLVDDAEQSDLSPIMNRLVDHIQKPDNSGDYSRILLEFAKLPRSAWRAAKQRLDLSIEAAKGGRFEQPYRFYFPATDCSFMFSPFPPGRPTTGPEGELARSTGLQSLTAAAKYMSEASRGIGALVSKDGEFLHLDWCLIAEPWERDPEFDALLASNNPFRDVREKRIDGFYFVNQ